MFKRLNTEKPSRNTAKAHKHHQFKKTQNLFFYSQYIYQGRKHILRIQIDITKEEFSSRRCSVYFSLVLLICVSWFSSYSFHCAYFNCSVNRPQTFFPSCPTWACAQLVRNGGGPVPPTGIPQFPHPLPHCCSHGKKLHRGKKGALESKWDLIQWENK